MVPFLGLVFLAAAFQSPCHLDAGTSCRRQSEGMQWSVKPRACWAETPEASRFYTMRTGGEKEGNGHAHTHLGFGAGHTAAHDEPMPAHASVPRGSYPLDLDVSEACLCKPLHKSNDTFRGAESAFAQGTSKACPHEVLHK
eukprot:1146984-Pelagomonas_calceolata.AAC.6